MATLKSIKARTAATLAKIERDWTPVLRDGVYCSPACGGGRGICDKSKYDAAQRDAEALAMRLGRGWKPYVYENLSWYWSVGKGKLSVRQTELGYYDVYLNTTPRFIAHGMDRPEDGIKLVAEQLSQHINKLTADLAEALV